MKPIQKDELYENLGQFLKSKGIELKEGTYTKSVHAGCSMLADAINLSQAGLERARNELGKRLDQVRQVIHESTAPKRPEPTVEAQSRGSSPKAPSGKARGRNRSPKRGKAKGGKKRAK